MSMNSDEKRALDYAKTALYIRGENKLARTIKSIRTMLDYIDTEDLKRKIAIDKIRKVKAEVRKERGGFLKRFLA